MADQFYLTAADVAVMRELIEERRNRLQQVNTQNRQGDQSLDHQDFLAPEVYVALTPPGGIPALSDLTPGSAECVVYRVIDSVLTPVTLLTRTVYNLGTSAIAGGVYVPVLRDKFETWLVATGGGSFGGICATVPLITDVCLTKDDSGNYHLTIQRQSFNTANCTLGIASCKTDSGNCCSTSGTGTSNDGPCCGLTDQDILCAALSAPGCWLDGLTLALPFDYTQGQWTINQTGLLPLPTGWLVSSDPCNESGRFYRLILSVKCVSDPNSPDFGKWLWAFYFETDVTLGTGYCVIASGQATPSSCSPFSLTLTGTLTSDNGGGTPTCNLAASADPLGCECVGDTVTFTVTKRAGIFDCQYPGGTGSGGGPGGMISRASLGFQNSGLIAVTTLTMSGVVVASGALLVVVYGTNSADPHPSSITWNGIALTKDGSHLELGQPGNLSIWSLAVATGASGDIVVTNGSLVVCAIEVIEVLGLVSNSVDTEADAGAASGTPTVPTPSVSADRYAQAAFVANTPSFSWTNFTDGGQSITVDSTPWNLTEGYKVTTSPGVLSPTLNAPAGGPWRGVCVVYK